MPSAVRDCSTCQFQRVTCNRGWFDEEGFLHITGRFKDEYKLANSKLAHPEITKPTRNNEALIAGHQKNQPHC